jgi:hypothetical protein
MFDRDYKLKPTTAADTMAAQTVQGQRKRLLEFSHHDPLTRRVFDVARHEGLSGEDAMTMLAYHALIQVEEMRALLFDKMMCEPAPRIDSVLPKFPQK